MDSFLREVFAFVCSQTPDRSWTPGGVVHFITYVPSLILGMG